MSDAPVLDDISNEIHAISDHGVAIGYAFLDGRPSRVFYSYAQDWLTHYQESNLIARDPTILYGFSTNGSRTWRELAADGFDAETFTEAAKFGIMNGTAFAIRVNGAKTVASVSHDSERLPDKQIQQITGLLAHGTVLAMSASLSERFQLDTIDKEYIRLLIDGYEEGEIAEALDLNIRQTRYRRGKIVKASDSKTISQAIYKIYAAGVL